jgi:hypothetical protein
VPASFGGIEMIRGMVYALFIQAVVVLAVLGAVFLIKQLF